MLRSNTAGKGGECGAPWGSPAAVTRALRRFSTNCSARLRCRAQRRRRERTSSPGTAAPAPEIRRTDPWAEHCANQQEPEPLVIRVSAWTPAALAHTQARAPKSLTACSSWVPLPLQPAEPGRRAAAAASPGGRASPAPPCSRPPSREEEQAGLRPDPPSDPGPADPGLRLIAGSRWCSLKPSSICALRPPHPLASTPLLTLKPPSISALPHTPPPGSLPYFTVPPYPRSQFPTPFHAPFFSSPVSKSHWWKGTQ